MLKIDEDMGEEAEGEEKISSKRVPCEEGHNPLQNIGKA
jgi:hypothetical protein